MSPLPDVPPPRRAGRRSLRRGAAVAALALGAGCVESLALPEQYARVTVTTATPAGEPAPGVTVELYTGQRPIEYAVTDARGRYVFERVPPALRNYAVVAHVPIAYRDSGEAAFVTRGSFDVPPNSSTEVGFVLVPCLGTIILTVRDQLGRPAPNVSVRIFTADAVLASVVTGADGTYTFGGLECRDHGLQLLPSEGYVLTGGRDSSFADGIGLHRGTVRQVTLRMPKAP